MPAGPHPEDPELRADVAVKLEEADRLLAASRWQAAIDHLTPVLDDARTRGDLRSLCTCAIRVGRAHTRLDNRMATAGLLREALAAAETLGDPALAVDVLRTLGAAHYRAGDLWVAQELLEEALRIVEDAGLADRRAGILVDLGNQSYERQSYEAAAGRYLAALRGEIPLEDRLRALCNLALVYCDEGRFADAIPHAEEARRLSVGENAYPHLADAGQGLLGRALGGTGDADRGLRLIDETMARATARNDRLRLSNGYLWRGEILERAGRLEEAKTAFTDAYKIATERSSPYDTSAAALGLARLAVVAHDHPLARRYAAEALEISQRAEGGGRVRLAQSILDSIPPSA